MNKFMKTAAMAFFSLANVATFANPCGGNQCGVGEEAFGGGYGNGGYEAFGGGMNDGIGNVIDRGSLSESGGKVSTNFSFNATTCYDTGDCANFAQAGGMGDSFQRSYTFIQTEGPSAQSSAGGGAKSVGEAGAFNWHTH